MPTTATEELISFLYNETSSKKSAQIKTALETDPALMSNLSDLQSAINELDTVLYSPRKESIENILKYGQKA